MNCKYCNQERKNENSLRNHERLCKENPNRQSTPFQNIEVQRKKKKSNQWNKPGYVISEETRKKISEKSKLQPPKSKEVLEKLSLLAKERKLGGVRQSKRIKYKNKVLGSSYEYEVVLSLDENNIRWDTCDRFDYIDPNNKHRTYTPDIYLIDYDVYLDPKNDFLIENVNPNLGFTDKEKINLVCEQNNIRVIILNKQELSWDIIKNKI